MNRIPRRNFLKHAAPAGCLSGGLVAASNRIAIVTPQRNLVVRTRPLGGRRVAAPGGRERRLMRHGVFVLSRLFRRLFLEYLLQAFDTGKLQFFSSLEPLHERCAFLRHLAPTRETEWVVYAKHPFAGPEQVLDYVGRYTRRVAISNNRLLDIDSQEVTFRYKDYRHDSQ